MKKITIICTYHLRNGECNSGNLFQILNNVKPDVIFEELTHDLFDIAYNKMRYVSEESDAIKDYLVYNSVIHVPVDTYPRPENYDDNNERVSRAVICNNNSESLDLYILDQEIERLSAEGGFAYLNSDEHLYLIEKHAYMKIEILNDIGDQQLLQLHQIHLDKIHKREYVVIQNIYDYCNSNEVNNGLLLIGSGHRNTIFDKIKEMEGGQELKINWIQA